MVVLEDREDVVAWIAAQRGILAGALISLEHAPAVIAPVLDRCIDFLTCAIWRSALTHVGDPLLTGQAIETESPRIA
jgi:hypothetical protein